MTVDPYSGFTQPMVEARYEQYVRDHHGDVTDLPRLCEVMWNSGAAEAVRDMVEFSDVPGMVDRVQQRVRHLHDLLEVITRKASDD